MLKNLNSNSILSLKNKFYLYYYIIIIAQLNLTKSNTAKAMPKYVGCKHSNNLLYIDFLAFSQPICCLQ